MSENKQIDDGGLAFPGIIGPPNEFANGMSLRDWFAGQALATMNSEIGRNEEYGSAMIGLARKAYIIADYMIAARKSGAA